jgi:hypothetical protein
MSLAEIIDRAEDDGVKLTLSPKGKVIVAGDKRVVNHWRPVLIEHKAELLVFLAEKVLHQPRQDLGSVRVDTDTLGCASLYVKGVETENWDECSGVLGGCGIEQASEFGNSETRQVQSEKATQHSDQVAGKDAATTAFLVKKKIKPSPLALEWLREHKNVLRLAGWTAPELYRLDKSRGLAWVSLWDKESLEVSIKEDGVIVFQFQSATNQTITQTARPTKRKLWK